MFSDTLVLRLLDSANQAHRPVYFALTLWLSPRLKPLQEHARLLGLARLVTPAAESYGPQLRTVMTAVLHDYRTGGLNSWRLRSAKPNDAGRMLAPNYAAMLCMALDTIRQAAPELRADLFHWYRANVEPVIPESFAKQLQPAWCEQTDVADIQAWCREREAGK